ncbi:MAG: PIG-L deacetylase family protein [Saprospiraceae bacterium]|nr:PIG-L family deacetylase [Lewinella sp.]
MQLPLLPLRKSLLLLLFSFLLWTHCAQPAISDEPPVAQKTPVDLSKKVLMAIFAHPDDESTIAPILARYAREGVKVYVVIATDGRLGVNDFSGLEAGDGLVAIRKEEMKCAADALGVELIHLNYQDQFRAAEGYDGHIPHIRAFLKEIYELVEKIQPDVLITWGPDGGSNHMDHRLAGATATQVFLGRDWEKPSSLYFYGTPSDQIEDEASRLLRGVAPKYLTTKISYTDEDLEAAFAAISCHKSQFQLDGLRERMEERATEKVVYLRKFVAPSEQSETIFE